MQNKPTRDESWLRDKHVGEKWPRFSGEVPPELAAELDKRIGKFNGPRSRADMVQSGLRLYLNAVSPEDPPPIETTATDIIDLPALRAAGETP